jgi:HAD superfamily hydrolase (TIGR01484 family)
MCGRRSQGAAQLRMLALMRMPTHLGRPVGQTHGVIRLVATDLDGTFWDTRRLVPEQHAEAARELASLGVTVLAATSRRPRVVRAGLGAAGLALPAVLVDGAIGIDFRTDQRFHEAMFEPTVAAVTLAAFRSAGLEPCVYVEDPVVDIIVADNPATCAAHLAYIADVARVDDLDTVVATQSVYAFSVLGLAIDRLEPAARHLRDHGMQILLYAEPAYGAHGLIVNPPGVSKWSGVEAYCRLAGINPTEVLAVGDGDNDVQMLARAAVAVAVKGGTAEVLEVADHVIDAPQQRGWASLLDLIERL